MRKINRIGLSALAVLAVSAVSSSTAHAAEGTATVSVGTTSYTALQSPNAHTITLPGGLTGSCQLVEFTGVITNGDTEMTARPRYEKCHVKGLELTLPLTIETTDCTFTFTDLTTTGVADTYSALTDLCPTGGPIHIKMYVSAAAHTVGTRLCEYTIAKQGPLAGFSFVDNTNGTLGFKLTEVSLILTRTFGTAGNCGGASTVSKYNGNTSMIPSAGTLGIHH